MGAILLATAGMTSTPLDILRKVLGLEALGKMITNVINLVNNRSFRILLSDKGYAQLQLMTIPSQTTRILKQRVGQWLDADQLTDYLWEQRVLFFRPHTLGRSGEINYP